jgi:hypothetical protein
LEQEWDHERKLSLPDIQMRNESFFVFLNYGGCSSMVERCPVEADVAGSIPVNHPKKI